MQYAADNVDHNVRTLDGKNTFHGMGIIATVTPKINDSRSMIGRKTDVTSEEISRVDRINIHFYSPSKNVINSVIYE